MQDLDRTAHWQQVYENKDESEVSWFQTEPTVSLELIANCQLTANQPVIDVGGGASVLVDRMLALGYSNLTVLDISSAALAKTQARLAAQSGLVQWVVVDITEYRSDKQFMLWHDRAVFHFLTAASDRQAYVANLKQSLMIGGHLILAAFAIGGPEKCSGLPVVQYDAKTISAELGSEFELVEERHEEHMTPARQIQNFVYFRFIRRE